MLKKVLPFKEDPHGKFKPNYEGPYLVTKVLSGRSLILSEMDGDVLPEPCNSDSVKDILYDVYSHSLAEMKRGHFLHLKQIFLWISPVEPNKIFLSSLTYIRRSYPTLGQLSLQI